MIHRFRRIIKYYPHEHQYTAYSLNGELYIIFIVPLCTPLAPKVGVHCPAHTPRLRRLWPSMTSKCTQSVQQTGAESKKTADVVCSRENTVDDNAENVILSTRSCCLSLSLRVTLVSFEITSLYNARPRQNAPCRASSPCCALSSVALRRRNRFLADVNSRSRSLYRYAIADPSVCLSICRLTVTLVRPTQPVEIFGNFFTIR